MTYIMTFTLTLVLPFLFLVGCASKDKVNVSLEEPPKFEKPLNSTTMDGSEKVGIKDNTVKIQKIMYLEEDLSKNQNEIRDMENAIYGKSRRDPGGIYLGLKECRKRLADKRIGGSGVTEPMEKWERISEKDDDFNYHVDKKNNVVAVSEEDLATRIENLRKLRRLLTTNYDSFKDKLDTCEEKYSAQLVEHGLNPDDTKASGEWVEGPNGYRVWKMKRPTSVDPEELMKRKAEREKAAK